jgi:hypothetical protein
MRHIHAGCASHPQLQRKCCVHLPHEERATRDVIWTPLYVVHRIQWTEAKTRRTTTICVTFSCLAVAICPRAARVAPQCHECELTSSSCAMVGRFWSRSFCILSEKSAKLVSCEGKGKLDWVSPHGYRTIEIRKMNRVLRSCRCGWETYDLNEIEMVRWICVWVQWRAAPDTINSERIQIQIRPNCNVRRSINQPLLFDPPLLPMAI